MIVSKYKNAGSLLAVMLMLAINFLALYLICDYCGHHAHSDDSEDDGCASCWFTFQSMINPPEFSFFMDKDAQLIDFETNCDKLSLFITPFYHPPEILS